jgi:hypothetical protein
MDLPDVRAGMAIMAQHIQQLSAALKQVRVRPGIGYQLKESSGGTSLVINPGLLGGAGQAACAYFRCTNASEGGLIKVEVAQNLIAGRYPDGMGLDFPPFKLTLSGNSYIYAKVTYNTTTLQILPNSDAITILQSGTLLDNTTEDVYILLATVVVGGDPEAITEITNICTEPVPNPCLLAWTE